MKISGSESEKTILIELGERIKQHRISLNITQAEMAEKCCVSSSTVTRIENGTDSMVSNYIKILSGLNLSGNINYRSSLRKLCIIIHEPAHISITASNR